MITKLLTCRSAPAANQPSANRRLYAFYAACERVGIVSGYEKDGAVIRTIRHSAATYLMKPESTCLCLR